MTAQTANAPSPPNPAPAGAATKDVEGSEGLDIKRVISGSTSEVPVDELSKKGFKRVKVLNQAVITKLIAEAVDRVIASRTKKIGLEEREKVIQESKSHFEVLARERLQRERDRIGELEQANESLLKETEELRQRLLERDGEIQQLREKSEKAGQEGGADRAEKFIEILLQKLPGLKAAPSGEMSELQKSIQSIAAKLDRLPGRGAAGGSMPVDEESLIEALFRMKGPESEDSNVAQVKVKEAKAGGVQGSLAKLKALQKGG